MKRNMLALTVLITGILLAGCNTVKKVSIQSTPQEALIMTHENEDLDASTIVDYFDPTPGEYRLNLWGKGKQRYVTAQKRGYEPTTKLVTMESPPQLSFDLKPIEGVPNSVFDIKNLSHASFYLLPPKIDVYKYTGAGNLGKKVFSPEMSETVTHEFFERFLMVLNENNRLEFHALNDEEIKGGWERLADPVKEYVLSLNAKRLKYYSRPPCVEKEVEGFDTFRSYLPEDVQKENHYLLFIWGKCISETKGRKTANFFLKLLSGFNPAAVYDPNAFDPRSGTLVVFYLMDAITSEVLHIQSQYFNADLSKEKQLEFIVDQLKDFPHIGQKEKR